MPKIVKYCTNFSLVPFTNSQNKFLVPTAVGAMSEGNHGFGDEENRCNGFK